jgi:hypothetical protein
MSLIKWLIAQLWALVTSAGTGLGIDWKPYPEVQEDDEKEI